MAHYVAGALVSDTRAVSVCTVRLGWIYMAHYVAGALVSDTRAVSVGMVRLGWICMAHYVAGALVSDTRAQGCYFLFAWYGMVLVWYGRGS